PATGATAPAASVTAPAASDTTPAANGTWFGPIFTPASASQSHASEAIASQSLSASALAAANFTPTDAYWATQPPAVQALRDMPDDQRFAAAQQLAQDGYKIDVPIMVWGWDPLVTMTVRQNMGFTWVPSALQQPVAVMPGMDFPGLPSYDAKNA